MKKLKVIFLGTLFWLSAVALSLGVLGSLVAIFSDDPLNLAELTIGMLFWGGLTYLFWFLFQSAKKSAAEKPKVRNKPEPEVDEGFIDDFVPPKRVFTARAKPSSTYAFDYTDFNGVFSQRKVAFKSVEIKNGRVYLNAVDLGKHASRTFRTDSIEDLVDVDTGELIHDPEDYFSQFV